DAAALQVALNIVQRATDALGILAGKPFPARPSPSESPPDQGHMPAKAGPVTGEPRNPNRRTRPNELPPFARCR
ncbi:hypothetical protein ACSQPA_006096, partial [Pseudomonas aeruginosa]